MNASVILVLFIVSIVIAIAVNSKTSLNIGFVGGLLAYIIGCWYCGFPVRTLISYTPTSICFQIVVLGIFFSFPAQNGCLEKLSNLIIYKCQNATWLLPLVIYLVCYIITALGAGAAVGIVAIGVIAFKIGETCDLNPLIIGTTLCNASAAGSQWPWSGTGITVNGLFLENFGEEAAYMYSIKTAVIFLVYTLLFTIVISFIFGGFKNKSLSGAIEKPEKLDDKQRMNMTIIIGLLALAVIFPALKEMAPGIPNIGKLAGYMDFQMLAIIGIILCVVLKLGDEKTAVAKGGPWSTIIMLTGMNMLIGIAKDGGAVDLISNLISDNVAPGVFGSVFGGLAGVMTLFSSGVVTMQTLMPITVQPIEALGINAIGVLSSIALTARLAAVSPFSTGGALVIGTAPNKYAKKLFIGEIISAIVIIISVMIFSALGVFNV